MDRYSNVTKEGIFCPSFQVERKTKAFNKYIGGWVWLLVMFTVDVLVFAAYFSFMHYFLRLVSTFIWDHFIIITILPPIIFIVFSYKIALWMISLLTSYKFEGNKIIRGRLRDPIEIDTTGLAIEGALTANMMSDMTDTKNVRTANTALQTFRIIRMILNNIDPEIVERYFDTDIYRKKVYYNPRLLKTTKYTLVYLCDNNKKLVIPKIYEGMFPVENKRESSFIGRILARVAIITAIVFLLTTVDLAVGVAKNREYLGNISETENTVTLELEQYGYEIKEINPSGYRYVREEGGGERISELRYFFDKKGNITDVDIQLYYKASDQDIREELSYIISTIPVEFDEEEVTEYLNLVEENVNGEFKAGRLKGEKYKLTLGKSGGYIDIHSY